MYAVSAADRAKVNYGKKRLDIRTQHIDEAKTNARQAQAKVDAALDQSAVSSSLDKELRLIQDERQSGFLQCRPDLSR